MHITNVVLKDGTKINGILWMWRPEEGWFSLGGREDGPVTIPLAECASAIEEGQRVGRNPDGTVRIEDVDLLEKARNSHRTENVCKCGNPGTEEHPCPYATDIDNDKESMCNCCENCEHECAQDI